MSARHPLMQFFVHAHLKAPLAEVSKPFCDFAERIVNLTDEEREEQLERIAAHQMDMFSELTGWAESIGCNTEATWAVVKIGAARDAFAARESPDACLRKLLEAKDCAVRAVLFKAEG